MNISPRHTPALLVAMLCLATAACERQEEVPAEAEVKAGLATEEAAPEPIGRPEEEEPIRAPVAVGPETFTVVVTPEGGEPVESLSRDSWLIGPLYEGKLMAANANLNPDDSGPRSIAVWLRGAKQGEFELGPPEVGPASVMFNFFPEEHEELQGSYRSKSGKLIVKALDLESKRLEGTFSGTFMHHPAGPGKKEPREIQVAGEFMTAPEAARER